MKRYIFLLIFCIIFTSCFLKTNARAFEVEDYSKEDAGYLGEYIPEEIIEQLPEQASHVLEDHFEYIRQELTEHKLTEEEKSDKFYSIYFEFDEKIPIICYLL